MTTGVSTTTPAVMWAGGHAGLETTMSPGDLRCRGPTRITIAGLPLMAAEWIQGAGAGVEAGPGATTLAAALLLLLVVVVVETVMCTTAMLMK